MANLKTINFFLIIICFITPIALADNNSITNKKPLNDHPSLNMNTTSLSTVIPFKSFDTANNLWKYKNYSLKFDATGYACELIANNKTIMDIDLSKKYGVVDFLVYIYLSEEQNYPYKVILIEAQVERETSWYYAITLKNDEVINDFFINQGRRFFMSTKEYLTTHPDSDEMYINPKTFIFISISNNEIKFKLDKEYLYPSEENKSNNGFIQINKKLSIQ